MSSEPPPAYSPHTGAVGTGGYTQLPAGAVGGYPQAPAGAVGGYTQAPSGAVGSYAQAPAGAVAPGHPDSKAHTNQPYPGSYQSGAQPGVYAGPPGYQPVPGQQTGYPAPGNQHPQTVIVQPQPQVIAVVGGCPACRIGVLEDDFTCLGVCCAILFFPLGLICCLLMRQRRCPNCGAVFG